MASVSAFIVLVIGIVLLAQYRKKVTPGAKMIHIHSFASSSNEVELCGRGEEFAVDGKDAGVHGKVDHVENDDDEDIEAMYESGEDMYEVGTTTTNGLTEETNALKRTETLGQTVEGNV